MLISKTFSFFIVLLLTKGTTYQRYYLYDLELVDLFDNKVIEQVDYRGYFQKAKGKVPDAFVMISLVEKDRLQHTVFLAPIFIDAHL